MRAKATCPGFDGIQTGDEFPVLETVTSDDRGPKLFVVKVPWGIGHMVCFRDSCSHLCNNPWELIPEKGDPVLC